MYAVLKRIERQRENIRIYTLIYCKIQQCNVILYDIDFDAEKKSKCEEKKTKKYREMGKKYRPQGVWWYSSFLYMKYPPNEWNNKNENDAANLK